MRSSQLYISLLIIFIHQVHSAFYQTLCFPKTDAITTSNLLVAYETAITNIINNTVYGTFDTETSDCANTTLSPISTILYDCFQCLLVPTSASTETSSYNHLVDINNDIPTTLQHIRIELQSSNVSYATYVTADTAPIQTDCIPLPYPRICKYDLAAVSNGVSDQWEFTMFLNSTSQKVQYEIIVDETTRGQSWLGIGFGTISMDGDAAIYSCGASSCSTPTVHDYKLELVNDIRELGGVILDTARSNPPGTDDFTGLSDTVSNTVRTVVFERAFNTNDAWDMTFTGTEQSLYLFAAIGDSKALISHDLKNAVKSHEVQLVQDPSVVATKWCSGSLTIGDCIIENDKIITNDPSKTPSITPSKFPTKTPSATPSNNPSVTPSVSPSEVPSGNPSEVPTVLLTPTESPSNDPTVVPSDPGVGSGNMWKVYVGFGFVIVNVIAIYL